MILLGNMEQEYGGFCSLSLSVLQVSIVPKEAVRYRDSLA